MATSLSSWASVLEHQEQGIREDRNGLLEIYTMLAQIGTVLCCIVLEEHIFCIYRKYCIFRYINSFFRRGGGKKGF